MARGGLHAISVCILMVLSSSCKQLAVSQSTVRYLPGFSGPLPFRLETGYVGVGESEENQLFYYFVESEKSPKEDPLVLWLTGGPGCSAWSGLVYEIGPLYFEYVLYNGSLPTLKLRQHSWTKISNIIFLDSPVWTGFSYSSASKVDLSGDIKSSKEVHQFLRKWLTDHPQFVSNPLYIGGDSYCGLTIPVIVHEIANGIDAGQEPILNLKGYFLGNPKMDRVIDEGSFVPYAHGMGLISNELYESTKKSCRGVYAKASNFKCSEDLEAVNKCITGLNSVHILEPKCPFASPKPKDTLEHGRSLKENSRALLLPDPLPTLGCRTYGYLPTYYWANDASVRKALHVRERTIGEWERCATDLPYVEDLKSSVKYHLDLITRGYRALIYSGDHDLKVPFVGTETWIRSLNLSIVDDWRPWSGMAKLPDESLLLMGRINKI
ncbi:serine carboxypeptidase-like 18 [Magnolia sinica]|uniref:serine carboxypeptidase-like 18 n=1 Tax=Magnolia sinica TaxID=86752 RepID=UPI002659EC1D|nr:serine carboxypeptidase-like 18 [Magnolia sinica]